MLFITNRTPKEGHKSSERSISFDYQDTTVSQNLYFCRRIQANQYEEIGHKKLFSELKTIPGDTQLLFYFHGFNNNMEPDIFNRAEKLESLFNQGRDTSLVKLIPLIWPCDDDSLAAFVDDYWDDQDAADSSGPGFGRLLGKFHRWQLAQEQQAEPCYRRINILAHSMGARVLINAISFWANRNGGEIGQWFRNIFLVAADIENHALEYGERGHALCDAARNVIVYYANDDLSMPASKVANLKNKTLSRRMGMTGPESIHDVPKKVYAVDCDNFNNSIDYPKGHAYFLEKNNIVSPALIHMKKAIENGRVEPDEREHELQKPAGL